MIAIDGHAGCGKSTTAKLVAKKLNYLFIDSGAMYRAVTFYLLQQKIDLDNKEAVINALDKINLSFKNNPVTNSYEIFLNGNNIVEEIRTMEVNQTVSRVSTIKEVRHFLVAQQQEMGKNSGIVMDGRDIGTVVFPDAALKVFMTASIEDRANRRILELKLKGEELSTTEIIENLKQRDHIDSTRKESPLRKAVDAVEIDTSQLTIEEQVNKVVLLAKKRLANL